MNVTNDLDRVRKKMARWRILRILYMGRPYPVGEGLIAEIITDQDLAMTVTEIRSALQYLQDRGYITVKDQSNGDGRHWEARLLDTGVDFVEYNSEDDAGIARPKQG